MGKYNSLYRRKYGKSLQELSKELKVSEATIISWEKQGFDIFHKAKQRDAFKRNSKLSKLWYNMKSRCGNPKDKKYKYYGGRGIKVKMTKEELLLLWERDKAYEMKQPSIDRIDPDGHYELSNCRFIEMDENRRRRRRPKKTQQKDVPEPKKPKVRIKIKKKKMHIKISPATKERLDYLCREKGCSLNWLVNRAIENYLKIRIKTHLKNRKNPKKYVETLQKQYR